MKFSLTTLSKTLTVVGLIYTSLIATSALAQGTQGPDTSGPILQVSAGKRVITEWDLTKLQNRCLADVVNTFLSRGQVQPPIQLKNKELIFINSSNFFGRMAFQLNTSDANCFVLRERNIGLTFFATADNYFCETRAVQGKFTMYLKGIPTIKNDLQEYYKNNEFGVPILQKEKAAINIQIHREEGQSTVYAAENNQVYFEYPIEKYEGCLRDGINQLGQAQ